MKRSISFIGTLLLFISACTMGDKGSEHRTDTLRVDTTARPGTGTTGGSGSVAGSPAGAAQPGGEGSGAANNQAGAGGKAATDTTKTDKNRKY